MARAIAKVVTDDRQVNQLQDNLLAVLNPALRSMSRFVQAPSSPKSPGDPGDWSSDGAYLYVCSAPNTWRRVAVATW